MKRKKGNWIIKDTKPIFHNDFFSVAEDEVIQPDGKDGKYATIDFIEGAAVLPIDDENNIYLTDQFRYALERNDLEVAGGAIENELPLDAARREAREEIGIEADEWTNLGKINGITSIAKSATNLFLARKLTFSEAKPEGTEKIKIIKMPLTEAVEKVMNGEITHDITCILILKTKLYEKR